VNCGKVTLETGSITEQSAEEMREQVNKRYAETLVQLQSTLAIGDYEELFFKFLEAMKNNTHWALFVNHLLILQNTYDSVIEDIYG
jgi:hypothetical protein